MSRTVKPQAERQHEILAAAQQLFLRHGYEQASVQAIIDAVGISKGAFYHHFPSKEALLERLIADLVERRSAAMAAELCGDGPALAKLERYFALSWNSDREQLAVGLELMRTLYRPDNLRLRLGLLEAARVHGAPILARVLAAGDAAGEWRCPEPAWTAELVLHVGSVFNDVLASHLFGPERARPDRRAVLVARARHTGDAIARLIGAADGAIRFLAPAELERVLEVAGALPDER